MGRGRRNTGRHVSVYPERLQLTESLICLSVHDVALTEQANLDRKFSQSAVKS